MENIFDSHAHYDSYKFDVDRDDILNSLQSQGVVGIVNCGCDMISSEMSIEMSKKYDYIYSACGVHPHSASEVFDSDYDKLYEMLNDKKCVALGEIGLDYHYDYSPRDVQKACFEKFLIMARDMKKPVIVHDREAHEDIYYYLDKYKPYGVMHCFSGSVELAKHTIDLGMYIGIGGAVTYKNARKPVEVVEYIPLDRLLIETDCPYMSPVPYRSKRCNSAMIEETAKKIAEIKKISAQEVLDITYKNALTFFNIA